MELTPTPTEPKQMAKGTMMSEDVELPTENVETILARLGTSIDAGETAGALTRVLPNGKRYVVLEWDFYQQELATAKRKALALSTPAPADASGWRSDMFTEEWLALPPDRKIDTMFAHGLLGYGELEPHFKIICEEIRSLSPPDSRPIDLGEIERALEEGIQLFDEMSSPRCHAYIPAPLQNKCEIKADRLRQALAAIKGEGA